MVSGIATPEVGETAAHPAVPRLWYSRKYRMERLGKSREASLMKGLMTASSSVRSGASAEGLAHLSLVGEKARARTETDQENLSEPLDAAGQPRRGQLAVSLHLDNRGS